MWQMQMEISPTTLLLLLNRARKRGGKPFVRFHADSVFCFMINFDVLSVSLILSLSLSLCLPGLFCLPLCLSAHLPVCLRVSLCLCHPVCMSICLCIPPCRLSFPHFLNLSLSLFHSLYFTRLLNHYTPPLLSAG